MTRKQQLDAIWRDTHPDYKGHLDGKRSILVYRRGTTIVTLDKLTDEEIADRLPRKRA